MQYCGLHQPSHINRNISAPLPSMVLATLVIIILKLHRVCMVIAYVVTTRVVCISAAHPPSQMKPTILTLEGCVICEVPMALPRIPQEPGRPSCDASLKPQLFDNRRKSEAPHHQVFQILSHISWYKSPFCSEKMVGSV